MLSRRRNTAGPFQVTCPAMTAGPRAPGVAPRVNQPATGGAGVSISPPSLSPSLTNFDWTPILGMDRVTGSDSGRTNPVILSRTSLSPACAVCRSGLGLGAFGEADGVLLVVGAPPTAEPEVDGLASAVHTSTAPIMAKPIAIQTRTNRLVRQRDELNNGFDPLVDSGRNRLSAQHPEAHRFAAAYQVSRFKNLIPRLRTPIQPDCEATL